MPGNAIRKAVRRGVSASSLRVVAEAWYLRQQAGTLEREAAEAAIVLLVGNASEPQRENVMAGLLDLLREAHRATGTEPPVWLNED